MKTDFLDAHERHLEDAEQLLKAGRWANADHLYGVAAECGLKRLMLAFGMKLNGKGSPNDQEDRVHADAVWARFESYRCGHSEGAAFVLPDPNPFSDWHVSQRYAHQSGFNQALAQSHQRGAQLVHKLIAQARLKGIVA